VLVPECSSTHCFIHRELLAIKGMPSELDLVMKQTVKMVNLIKSRSLNSRPFSVLCEEMGSVHKHFTFPRRITVVVKVVSTVKSFRAEG
jgi:hypothetical protein